MRVRCFEQSITSDEFTVCPACDEPPPRGSTANPVCRFSATVSSGKMSRPCGTHATPRRARSCVGNRVMSSPRHTICPPLTGCAPVMARSKLVLPTPLRPKRHVTRPASARIDTPRNAIAALHSLGLGEGIEQLGRPVRRREYRSDKGRLLCAMDEEALWQPGSRPRIVRRSDLMRLLAEASDGEVSRRTATVDSVETASGGATVTFADGRVEEHGVTAYWATENGLRIVAPDVGHAAIEAAVRDSGLPVADRPLRFEADES